MHLRSLAAPFRPFFRPPPSLRWISEGGRPKRWTNLTGVSFQVDRVPGLDGCAFARAPIEDALAYAQLRRRDFDQLVGGDELDGALDGELARWLELDRVVGCVSTHIRLLFLFRWVDDHIVGARILTD